VVSVWQIQGQVWEANSRLRNDRAQVLGCCALDLPLLAVLTYEPVELPVQDVDAGDIQLDAVGAGKVAVPSVAQEMLARFLHIRLIRIACPGCRWRCGYYRCGAVLSLSLSLSLSPSPSHDAGSGCGDDGHSGNRRLGTGFGINHIGGHSQRAGTSDGDDGIRMGTRNRGGRLLGTGRPTGDKGGPGQ
jgi:hypothetical protein